MPYVKTTWVDRVVSGSTVITAGTPLSASNLNKIENQLESVTTLSEGSIQSSNTALSSITSTLRTTPTFSIDKTGAGVGDGANMLRLNTERSWSFIQRGTGASANLSLTDNTGAKNFLIQGTSFSIPYTIATFSTGTTASNSSTTLAGSLNVSSGGVDVTGNSSVTGTLSTSSGLTVSSGGASITGNSSITGTLGVSARLTASNGLTLSAGTVLLPAGTIASSELASNSVVQAKIKTAVDSSYSGTLTASSSSGTLLGGIANINPTFSYAFFPQIRANSSIAVVGGGSDSFTDGRASFGLRNTSTSSLTYQLYIRYITAS